MCVDVEGLRCSSVLTITSQPFGKDIRAFVRRCLLCALALSLGSVWFNRLLQAFALDKGVSEWESPVTVSPLHPKRKLFSHPRQLDEVEMNSHVITPNVMTSYF